MRRIPIVILSILFAAACEGPAGTNGAQGPPGAAAIDKGSIAGTVKDLDNLALTGVMVTTVPPSSMATTDAQGNFTLSGVPIGSYSVVATFPGYTTYTLTGIGVAGGGTTNVRIALTIDPGAPSVISGVVTDSKNGPVGGATVSVQGQTSTTVTDAAGAYTLTGVSPGPVFLAVAPPASAKLLPTETRSAVFAAAGGNVTAPALALSARPTDAATYIGMKSCAICHGAGNTTTGNKVAAVSGAAHYRSLTRINRDAQGRAPAGAFARALNPTLTTARTVMTPLPGTIAVPAGAVVTGTGTAFQTGGAGVALQVGDKLGYTPKGLGWTVIGTVQSVDGDTQVTLAAAATFAPQVTSLPAGTRYGVARLSSGGHIHMLPEDAGDIVAPAWPGVKATNPNYDPNDPCIYAAPPSGATCAAGGTVQYADGQVNVYWCNLKGSTVQGVQYDSDQYVQKFGGNPWTCSDGTFWDGATTPAVPLVRIDVIYGGQGDKDGSMASHPNLGVFKQRFQGRLADVKSASAWQYTTILDRDRDSLTLPIQILESGDRVNGGFKMNGYHPTEQKFPGESWSQRTRTFSHGCAGCHNTGMIIEWDMEKINLQVARDDGAKEMDNAAIKTYRFMDENITCEQCHGPGSEHASNPGRGNSIINPSLLTAEAERQVCGKCHTYDDATNAKPAQTYGFEFAWNSDNADKIGNGSFVPGVYQVNDFFDNFGEMKGDGEAFWDPLRTNGKLYGQAHRQQNAMLSFSAHTNNAYEKVTCTSCHDAHSTYRVTSTVVSGEGDVYSYQSAEWRDNTLCVSCHAGFGPFAGITKDDVAALHMAGGGTALKNGAPIASPAPEATEASLWAIAAAVAGHMLEKAKMGDVEYAPGNDALPTGRCSSCHMPKLAKSGGYVTGPDQLGNEALVEGDQASHVFDVVWPYESRALSMGGPTFQSGYYAQAIGPTNVKYDKFGYMPNSCGKCHTGARKASMFCPDTGTVYPTYWPLGDPAADPNMSWVTSNCFPSKNLP